MARELADVPGAARLYGRAALQALRRVGVAWPRSPQPTDDLSDAALAVAGVGLSTGRLAAYREVCGLPGGDERVPPAYPHVLAFGLHLEVMTAPTFPFRAVGMVHIANSVRQERPLSTSESVDLSVYATGLRPHRRGRQVTLVTEASVGSEQVWREESVFLSRERAVAAPSRADGPAADVAEDAQADQLRPRAPRRLGVAGNGTDGTNDPGHADDGSISAASPWLLPGDLGRRYAAASGDRNPIHLYDLTARPFGFRRHIAHGMWTKARALAELADLLPERFRVDVEFRSPLALPATAQLRSEDRADGIGFEVAALPNGAAASGEASRTCLVGVVQAL